MPLPMIVTIDGPAGTGKSTVSSQLAARLGADCLDTGAMYRAASLLSVELGIAPDDGPAIAAAVAETGIGFDWKKTPAPILLGGRQVDGRIRDHDVSSIVSIVAEQSEVRRSLVQQQRRIGKDHPCLVTEGRDQGSVVFPNATAKFYLDATVDERARRRILQLEQAGKPADPASIRRNIEERDRIDSTREDSPLVRPEGCVTIDSSNLSIDEVVDRMERVVRDRLDALQQA